MKQKNLHPLRMIRIAKNYNLKEMAECFEVSSSYFCDVEKSIKRMKKETLIKGLTKLGLTYDEYIILEEFEKTLMSLDIDKTLAYRLMLMKTLSYLIPEEKEKTDKIIKKCLEDKERRLTIAKKLSPLRIVRILKDLNQRQMADKLGVEMQTIHTIENGKKNIGEKTLSGLSKIGFDANIYIELEMFRSELLNMDLAEEQAYELMIIKTLSYLIPEAKEQFDTIIDTMLSSSKTLSKKINI